MVTLVSLPTEVLHLILLNLQPHQVAKVALVCHSLHERIYSAGSDHLWTQLFLRIYDAPHPSLHRTEVAAKWCQTAAEEHVQWHSPSQIRLRERALKQIANTSYDTPQALRASITAALLSMAQTQLPRAYDPTMPNLTRVPRSLTSEALREVYRSRAGASSTPWSALIYPLEAAKERSRPKPTLVPTDRRPSQATEPTRIQESGEGSHGLRRSSRLSSKVTPADDATFKETWAQNAAQLNCLHGLHRFPETAKEKALYRGKARELVYGTARFGWENSKGPFLPWRVAIKEPRLTKDGEDENDEQPQPPSPSGETGMEGVYVFEDGTGEEVAPMDEDDGHVPSSDEDQEPILEAIQRISEDALHMDDMDDSESEDEDWDPAHHAHLDDSDMGSDGSDDDDETGSLAFINLISTLERRSGRDLRNSITSMLKGTEMAGKVTFHTPSLHPHILRAKTVDWRLVEAVMVVMSCNVDSRMLSSWSQMLWGNGVRLKLEHTLERRLRPVNRDWQGNALESDSDDDRNTYVPIWPLLRVPIGWEVARGEVWADARRVDKQELENDAERPLPAPVRDWAHVNSLMIGTYAFLDFSDFLSFNIGPPAAGALISNTDEAVGPLLQLRLSIVPPSALTPQRRAEAEHEDQHTYSTCKERELYPPLHFLGTSHDHSDSDLEIRGQIHGHVRPVFEGEPSASSPDACRPIAALHWIIVHSQDGEDRWHLSGVQPGPPGTMRPIYGIWTDAERVGAGPQGPFMYWQADRRTHEEIKEEAHEILVEIETHADAFVF